MLKHLDDASIRYLLEVFNRIWVEGVFPSQWREGTVVPILKPGHEPSNAASYRPICLTNGLCKLLERMVNRRLVWVLEKRELLTPYQCGFRPFHFIIELLVRLEKLIQDAFLKGQRF